MAGWESVMKEIEMSEIVVTDAGEVRELTVDELDAVSGGALPLTLDIGSAIIRLISPFF
jgi:hypothetical protein